MAVLTVELCGRLADMAAAAAVTLDVAEDGLSIADVRGHLARTFPALTDAITSDKVRACVDEAIVDDRAIVRAGQAVAFFPPLSGG